MRKTGEVTSKKRSHIKRVENVKSRVPLRSSTHWRKDCKDARPKVSATSDERRASSLERQRWNKGPFIM